jgi:hypothetical protein
VITGEGTNRDSESKETGVSWRTSHPGPGHRRWAGRHQQHHGNAAGATRKPNPATVILMVLSAAQKRPDSATLWVLANFTPSRVGPG